MENRHEQQCNQRTVNQNINVQQNVSAPMTNRQVDQTNGTQCTCHAHTTQGKQTQSTQGGAAQRMNLHTEYESNGTSESQFFQSKK